MTQTTKCPAAGVLNSLWGGIGGDGTREGARPPTLVVDPDVDGIAERVERPSRAGRLSEYVAESDKLREFASEVSWRQCRDAPRLGPLD